MKKTLFIFWTLLALATSSRAGSLSDAYENWVLDKILNNTASQPAGCYLILCTATPTDSGTLNELSGSGYARESFGLGSTYWSVASSRQICGASATLTFGPATANWSAVTHWGLMTASSGGSLIAYGALDESRTVIKGESLKIYADEICVGFEAGDNNDNITDYAAHQVLEHLFDYDATWDAAPDNYIGLSDVNPGDSGGITGEPTIGTNNYARKSFEDWDTAASGATANTSEVVMNTASGDWGGGDAMSYFFISDASTAGNVLFYGNMDAAVAVNNGETPKFPIGAIDVTCSD